VFGVALLTLLLLDTSSLDESGMESSLLDESGMESSSLDESGMESSLLDIFNNNDAMVKEY